MSDEEKTNGPEVTDLAKSGEPDGESTKYSIETAIHSFIHRIRDVDDCARFLLHAREQHEKDRDSFRREIRALQEKISGEWDRKSMGSIVLKKLYDGLAQAIRLASSNPDVALGSSLFLGLFSAYDAFTGDLLRAFFTRKPELFYLMRKDVPLKQILSANSLDELKTLVLDQFIDEFRRDSYVEQFGTLQRIFEIELKKFDQWSAFVEASQRRNVIAHCGGIVSEQYLHVCRQESCDLPKEVVIGYRLQVDEEYLRKTCLLLMGVGVKLAHTLSRKLLPADINSADQHLRATSYEALKLQEWAWAAILGEFAVNQKRFSTDLDHRIFVVNYAIAVRFRDTPEAAQHIMAKYDWSSSCGELRLADAVLRDDYNQAATIMREIGKKGNFLKEESYQTWPLFREYRSTEQFLNTYKEIYGHEFIPELPADLIQTQPAKKGNGEIEPATTVS